MLGSTQVMPPPKPGALESFVARQKAAMATNWAVEFYIAKKRRKNGGSISVLDHLYRALASPGSSTFGLILAIVLQICSVGSVLLAGMQLDKDAIDFREGISCPKAVPKFRHSMQKSTVFKQADASNG